MKIRIIATTIAIAALGSLAVAQSQAQNTAKASPEAVAKAVVASWKNLTPELQSRLDQDMAMKACSEHHNDPPKAVTDAILKDAKATIVYPADGKFMGDWKKGDKGALNGYGLRMGDDPKREIGGNCYACHQLNPKEISYGTLGPPLAGYGKIKGNTPEAQKEVYEKIYNTQAAVPCSNMPRYGHNKVLTIEQIKDYVALLLDPESNVNK